VLVVWECQTRDIPKLAANYLSKSSCTLKARRLRRRGPMCARSALHGAITFGYPLRLSKFLGNYSH
jgi:hypothetical protein